MAKEIENKVVSMDFDNKRFATNVSGTIGMLDKLKSALSFGKAGKSFDDVNASASKVNLSHIASAVDNISSKFSIMGGVALSVINNVVTAAMSAGSRIVKALALDPIMDGFREYETNMNSIQTILSNTRADGTNLEQVNAALEKLNVYSDQTIYNFAEMARNIGTFTAAGVGLDQSVNAIKGIANLAAISGSNSQQASTAMYQLSQALAAGKVNLMDWNSVVNAGMGGEVFKKALFETGKAMKTITDVPVGASFEEWEKKGGTFREQMEKGWLTAEVLSTTLEAFSGDLDEAGLKALGFSEAAAKEMVELGKVGQAAATEVKTVTQLMSTVKESVGSGWSQTFKLIIGDFEEAKKLFTDINTSVSGFVENMSNARNDLLKVWKLWGGREAVIEGLKNALTAIGDVLKTIGTAFRDVFPPVTAKTLLEMSHNFAAFTKTLIPSKQTLSKIGDTFRGVFSILAIGVEIVKNVYGVFKEFFTSFKDANGAQLLEFFGDLGRSISDFRAKLVGGGGISDFFEKYINPIARFLGSLNFAGAIDFIIDKLAALKDAVVGLFGDDPVSAGANSMSNAADRLGERWQWLISVGEALGNFGTWLKAKFQAIGQEMSKIFDAIAESFSEGDFNIVLDALNTGLFAGLILLIRKFINEGFKFDFGDGLLEKIGDSFDQLTSTLSAMQANLRAEALMKIAIAIGVLTASLLVLSMIDSDKLTKALTATAVGFGQLVGAMALMGKAVADPRAAAKMGILAFSLIALAGAMVIMAVAAKIFATMSWEELAKGLLGLTGVLGGIVVAMNKMPENGMMIKTGLAIVALAIGIGILSLAAKVFSTMSWEELAQGLLGVAGTLTAITVAMNKLPAKGMVQAGIGIIAIALGITILSGAVAIFGNMDLGTLIQGLIGLAVALGIIVVAMAALSGLPMSLPVIGASLILVGIGLAVVTGSILAIGSMPLGTLVQGLIGIAAALAVLAIGLYAMAGTIPGAIAMTIAAGALVILSKGIETMASIGLGNVLIALVGVAAALGVLAIAALLIQPALPALLGLGVALLLVGAGGALFGVAALAIASAILIVVTAFEKLAGIKQTGIDAIFQVIDQLIAKLPSLATALVDTLVNVIQGIIDALPELIAGLGKVVDALLEFLIKEIPKLGQTITVLIHTLTATIRANFPEILQTGIDMLLELLRGIDENIEEITDRAISIITKFLETIAERTGELVDAGMAIIEGVLEGIGENIDDVVEAGYGIVIGIIEGVTASVSNLITAGRDLIIAIIKGIGNAVGDITAAGADVVVKLINGIDASLETILTAGRNFVVNLINGIGEKAIDIITAGKNLIVLIMKGIGENIGDLVTEGVNIIILILQGIEQNISRLQNAGVAVILKFIFGLGEKLQLLIDAGFRLVISILNGIADSIEKYSPQIRAAGWRIVTEIISGITDGFGELGEKAKNAARRLAGGMLDAMKGIFDIRSPSKEMIRMAGHIADGLVLGFRRDTSAEKAAGIYAENMVTKMNDIFAMISTGVVDLADLNPTITPVLDMSNIKNGATEMSNLLSDPVLDLSESINRAFAVSAAANAAAASADNGSSRDIVEQTNNFNQTINAPKSPNAADVYRGSKTQFAKAQKELASL